MHFQSVNCRHPLKQVAGVILDVPKPLVPPGELGFSASGDAQRSPRALSLLQWYYQRMEPLPEVSWPLLPAAALTASRAIIISGSLFLPALHASR